MIEKSIKITSLTFACDEAQIALLHPNGGHIGGLTIHFSDMQLGITQFVKADDRKYASKATSKQISRIQGVGLIARRQIFWKSNQSDIIANVHKFSLPYESW